MNKGLGRQITTNGGTMEMQQSEYHATKPRNEAITPELYQPMEVPEHIYLSGGPRKPMRPETKPEMVVPSRITVGGGDTTIAAKAQPMEVLTERQTLLPSSENDDQVISVMNAIPDLLTANELPQEDLTQHQYTPASVHHDTNPHYSSQTSIAVDQDPLRELKLMRRQLNRLSNRVCFLELENGRYRMERPYLWGLSVFSSIASILLLMGVIKGLRR